MRCIKTLITIIIKCIKTGGIARRDFYACECVTKFVKKKLVTFNIMMTHVMKHSDTFPSSHV